MRPVRFLLMLAACVPLSVRSGFAQERPPAEAVEALVTPDDLSVELFAAEPVVFNPTSIDVDYRGRVWIMEGFNYRPEANPQNPVRERGDRILILEDTDGDGRADTERVFYQGRDVDAAMGLTVLGSTVIVAAYENVFIFTDTDGDDAADRKDVLFTGINESTNDHSVHTVVFGPDGKLYFGVGNGAQRVLDADGSPVVDRAGNEVTNRHGPYRQGMVFRVNPDGSEFEVLGDNFRNPYELAVDSYGTIWQSDNDDDGYRSVRINYVMEFGDFGFTDQLTGTGWRSSRTGMADEIPSRHWHQNDPGVVPNLLITGAGSPTGILAYEGRFLPPRFWDELIHADAGPNVVRSYAVEEDDAGFTAAAEVVLKGVDDQWFRPTDVAVAPDGSVFVADWYDPILGGHQAGDVQSGRIFRLAPPGSPYSAPELSFSTPDAAVRALTSPNLDARYRAWQRLHEMQEGAEPALSRLFEDGDNPRHRARALWLLTKIDGRGDVWVRRALVDDDPKIRVTGVRAARQLGDGRLLDYLNVVVRDPSPAVRREAAIALRYESGPAAADLWTELALQHDGRDRWYLEALGIGAEGHWDEFFAAWMYRVGDEWAAPGGRDVVWRARTQAALPFLAALIRDPATAPAELRRCFRSFDFHDGAAKQDVLVSLLDEDAADIATLALTHLDDVEDVPEGAVDRALASAYGSPAFVELVRKFDLRERASDLLGYAVDHSDEAAGVEAASLLVEWDRLDLLLRTLHGEEEGDAVAVARLLRHVGREEVVSLLKATILDEGRPLAVRREAMEAYGDGFGIVRRLLDLVKTEDLPESLEPAAVSILMDAYEEDVRAETVALFDLSTEADMQPVRQLVAHEGDPAAGRTLFGQHCQSCHVVGDSGVRFGPDLTTIGDKLPKDGLYTSILFPAAGIAFGYEGYVFEMADGSEIAGYVESETARGVTVRVPGGLSRELAAEDVVRRRKMGTSLMPSTFTRTLSQQQVIDLVEYLTTLRNPSP